MIRRIVLRNFGPFRGEHVVELGPKAYAVNARFEADPSRSNTGGKSMLLEAIDFAFFGRWKRERGFRYSDDWITRGEPEGAVSVVLEGDASVKRERRRGKPTQIRFSDGRGPAASQEEAERALARHLRLSAADATNAYYFEQGKMARFVHADPADRLAVVSGWLGLGRADAAEEIASEALAAVSSEIDSLTARRLLLEQQLDAVTSTRVDAGSLVRGFEEAEAKVAALTSELEASLRTEADARLVAEHDRNLARGMALRTEVDQERAALEADLEMVGSALRKMRAEADEKEREVKRRLVVAKGRFDGRCPVASIDCPAKDRINQDRNKANEALAEAKQALQDISGDIERVEEDAKDVDVRKRSFDEKEAELARLRAWMTENAKAAKAAKRAAATSRPSNEVSRDLREARGARDQATDRLQRTKAADDLRNGIERDLEAARAALHAKVTQAKVAAKARAIFAAARRRVAERAFATITDDASRLLATAGVDLELEARWEREGRGPAKTCEKCGAAFPASAKVKECARCGEVRGLHSVQKLDFHVSPRSGGADDVAGVGLQLAAGAWLLRSRESSFSTALLDEPFAAVDKAWRHGLARALARSSWYRQMLVISHDPAASSMFPGRIDVVVRRDGSRMITVDG